MSGKIYAPNKTTEIGGDPNDVTNKYGDITGTDVSDRRALDVAVLYSSNAAALTTIIGLLEDILVALGAAPTNDFLLLETDDFLLLESGDKVILD